MSSISPSSDFLTEPSVVQPQWPKVVGILSIVFAGLGLTCVVCGVGLLLAMPWFFANNPDVGELPPNMRPTPEQLVGFAFGFGLSILLLVSGILTLRRRPVGRLLHLLYAGLSVPLVAVNSYMQWKQMALMEQWLRENPNSPFAAGQSSTGNMIGLVFGIFFGLAYPLFLLVWFGLVKRSAASMGQNESETVI